MLHLRACGACLSWKRELKGEHFPELRVIERPWIESRAKANSPFEGKVRDKPNHVFQNLMAAKNVGKIFTSRRFCSDYAHSEYGLQQATSLGAPA
jgi:hypothetical protein